MKSIKLSELIDAVMLDFGEEYITKVDLQNGCVVTVERAVISAVEESDEEALEDWEKSELETARAIFDDPGERFVDAPSKFDFHEYRHMERFIGTLGDSAAAEQLFRAIKGKGAFRYFKDTAHRLGVLEQWYQYRDNAMKEFVLGWAEANKIPILDDTRPKP